MIWQSLDGQSQVSYWGLACLSWQYHCQHIRSLVIFVLSPSKFPKMTSNCFKVFLLVSNTHHGCQVCISSSPNGSQDVCLFSCLCAIVSMCLCSVSVCMCVLVGRMSIPSVTVSVPSFHAPAAPRESPSLGSLSVLFNERASHQNAG